VKEVWSVVRQGFAEVSQKGKAALILTGISLIALSALDALALYLLTRSFEFSKSSSPTGIVVDASVRLIAGVLSLFVLRSVLSTAVGWTSVSFLAKEQALLGTKRFSMLMSDQTNIEAEPDENYFYNSVDRGPEFLVMSLVNAATLISELTTVIVILGVFLYLDPLTATVTLLYFLVVASAQHQILARRSARQGELVFKSQNAVYQLLNDASRLRMIMPVASQSSIQHVLTKSLSELSNSRGLSLVLSFVPRYLLELTFAMGLGVMGATAFLVSGPTDAIASLVLFSGISFRLLPIVNRVQSLALTLLAHTPIAKSAFVTISTSLPSEHEEPPSQLSIVLDFHDVTFSYPDQLFRETLSRINLSISSGKQYAVVGPSGSGKTTLAKLMLGRIQPSLGTIKKSDRLVSFFVPQDTHLAYASLSENVSLLWDWDQIDFGRVEVSLQLAGLDELIPQIKNPERISNNVVSGGQKQRIGLARAFYSGANFIVLDEVTSSLDAATETGIVDRLCELRGLVTTVIIAHRLSTIQRSDHVFYLDSGHLIGSGAFGFLATALPQLQEQIRLGEIRVND
jgi:ABC-type bacteriocin/lantibiotic exporter with double-glycine peptidase domain